MHWRRLIAHLPWASLLISATVAAGPIADPIQKSGLSVHIQDYIRLPQTGSFPNARINFLREEPGGSDRLFVNDLNGYLYSVDKSTLDITTFLDFTAVFPDLKTESGLASGVVTFAFHPEFATNGKLYTVHIENRLATGSTPLWRPPSGDVRQHSVITEWTADDSAANVFSGDHREMLRIGSLGSFHPIGDLGFHPLAEPGHADYGLLYVASGEAQSFRLGHGDNLQRLDSYLGTILRIDPDPGRQPLLSANGQYSIPPDNPWASDGDPNTLGEIYAYGFRNPHRFTWDPETRLLFTLDIGQNDVEEVNIVERGANYGWSEREGTFLVGGDPLPPEDSALDYVYPAAQYDHGDGRAISSGFVYRGHDFPRLQGKFIFGDIVNGRIFYSEVEDLIAAHDHDPGTTAPIHELQLIYNGSAMDLIDIVSETLGTLIDRTDLRLGMDAAGELYIMTKQDGYIRRLVNPVQPGDVNFDGEVNTADIILMLGAGKFEQDTDATFSEGDVDGAPNADFPFSRGVGPPGNGRFDTDDIIAILASGLYEQGIYASVESAGPLESTALHDVPEPATLLQLVLGALSLTRPIAVRRR